MSTGNGIMLEVPGSWVQCSNCSGRIGVSRDVQARATGKAQCSSCARKNTAAEMNNGKPTIPKAKRQRQSRHVG